MRLIIKATADLPSGQGEPGRAGGQQAQTLERGGELILQDSIGRRLWQALLAQPRTGGGAHSDSFFHSSIHSL